MSRHLRIMSVLFSATMFIMVSSSTYAKCVFSFDESPSDTSEVHLGYVTEDQVDYEISIRDLLRNSHNNLLFTGGPKGLHKTMRLYSVSYHASHPPRRHTAYRSAKNILRLRHNCFFVCAVRCAPVPGRSGAYALQRSRYSPVRVSPTQSTLCAGTL